MTRVHTKRNVGILAVGQALFTSSTAILIAVGGLVGYSLAPDKSLATLPVTSVVAGTAIMTIPASLIMGRIGRRAGFMLGTTIGITGALIASLAVYWANFWLLCFGTLITGMYSAFAQYYRFAAADSAGDAFKSKAISLVLAGGVIAGFVGPELAKWSYKLFELIPFLGTYLAVVCLTTVAFVLVSQVRIPKLTVAERQEAKRPLPAIMGQGMFIVAALNGVVGYGIMSLIMTATPLAMQECNFTFDDSATVIQWHVVGMFGPSFITGTLINRFGVLNVMLTGSLLMVGCLAMTLTGIDFVNFWLGLVLLGVGWNFMFVGGTTLLTRAHTAPERFKTQAANDFLTFGAVATASLSSGQLLHWFDWQTVNLGAIPFLVLASGTTMWYALRQRRIAAAA
jgi:predicted MFS family arabinose efflux permease